MKVKYQSVTGETSEVEISDDIGAFIVDDIHREQADDKRHHRHCCSLNAMAFESSKYAIPDFTEKMFDDGEEDKSCVREAFSKLTDTQQHYLKLLAKGLSIREIARQENKNFRTVRDSIVAAKKKFLKFYKNTPSK